MTAPRWTQRSQIRGELLLAGAASSGGPDRTDLLAPVQTIFPELKISAVVLGSRILMMTAAKRWSDTRSVTEQNHQHRFTVQPLLAAELAATFGLYSAFLAWRAINFRSKGQPRLTVETMFLHQISCERHGRRGGADGYGKLTEAVG